MNPTARKLTALSLAAVMGLGLAACSGGSGNGDATGTASPTPGTTAEPTSYADQIVVGITAEPKYIEPNATHREVSVEEAIFILQRQGYLVTAPRRAAGCRSRSSAAAGRWSRSSPCPSGACAWGCR